MFWNWIYQQKPLNHDIWIIPLNLNSSHWVVAIVVLKLKLIVHLDSLHGINRNLLRTILNYVVVIACIFGFNFICIWLQSNIAISISYTECQISMLTFDIGNCIAFTSILSKLPVLYRVT